MKTIRHILLLIIIATSFQACSEDTLDDTGLGTITGTVVEEGTNEPVPNARISTNPSSSIVFTDEEGAFILTDIPVDDYSVEARKEGLLTMFEGASVLANATVNLVFEMMGETAGNRPPGTPEAIFPEDKSQGVPVNVDFTWSSNDPEDDPLVYHLEIRNDNDEEVFLFDNLTDTIHTVEGLEYNTKYFWQVRASDELNHEVLSPLYSFTTMEVPENRVMFARIIQGNSVIFAQDLEGNEYQLTSSGQSSFRPRKSNSGNKVAFLRIVAGKAHLFTMDPAGTQLRQVTTSIPVNGFDLTQLDFSWSNDGAYLLYPSFDKLYRINAAGGGTELVYQTQNGKFITEVAASDETGTIALVTNTADGYDAELFTMDSAGTVQNRILTNVAGAVGGLDLSVRGDLLLYTHDVSGFENDTFRRLDSRMFIYNLETGETNDLSLEKPAGTNDFDPRFSPNEAEVVFVNTSNDEISQRDIYRLALETIDGADDQRTLFIENASMPDWE